jgi:hypothetical protein
MPLLDHFRPPLHPERHWESFHTNWCTQIGTMLNLSLLPHEYFAEVQTHVGGRVEVDVATLERDDARPRGENGPVATVAAPTWAPPVPAATIPSVFPDEFEVQVFGMSGGATLVAAIELVSPGNKDRPESRRAFAIKCAAYLQRGVGLVVVDVVTDRLSNLHDELIALLQQPDQFRFAGTPPLYVVAYRPARREPGGDQIDLWPTALTVGSTLPLVPLALRGGPTLPLDLEKAYAEARRVSRL